MHQLEIKIDDPDSGREIHNYSCSLPEKVDEMDTPTFVNWCALIHSALPEEELKVRAFLMFARIDLVKLAKKAPSADPLELFSQVHHLIDPLINQRTIEKDLFLNRPKGMLSGHFPMGDYLSKVSYRQFGTADHAFLLYLKNKQDQDLNEFCAAVMPLSKEFTEEVHAISTAAFSQVAFEIKTAILFNFWGLRNWQKLAFPHAFSGSESETSTIQTDSNLVLTDWTALSINIAESGVFGYKEIVDRSPINDVLKFMHERKLDALKRKKKQPND